MVGQIDINQGVQKLDLVIMTNGHKAEVLKKGVINTIKVNKGDKLQIIEKINDEEILANNVIATRSGDTLQLTYSDNTSLHVENFYTTKEVFIELPSSSPNAVFQLNSASVSSFQTLPDGTNFLYSSGDKAILSHMALSNPPLQLALHDHIDFVHSPRFVDAGNIATDALPVGEHAPVAAGSSIGAGIGATQILLGAVVIGGVAVAVGGGGGGSSSSPSAPADTTAPDAPIVALVTDSGESNTDKITNQSTVHVTNQESGATVQYSSDGTTWSTTQPTATAGSNTLHVRQTDAAGNASSITDFTFSYDTVAPLLQSIAAHSADQTIVLTYDTALDATNVPEITDFTITTGGNSNTVASVVVSGMTLTLTMTDAFVQSDAVTIDYANGSNTALAIQDIAGNDAATISVSSGLVADGYVRGAEIWIDTNGDGVKDYDTGETTDVNGNFFLPTGTPSGAIIAVGGVNIDTGVPNTMELKAPEGSTVINPLTTLVQAVIEQSGATATEASAQVVQALGLTQGTDLTSYDPITAGDTTAQKAAATIATITILAETADTTAESTIVSNLVAQITQSNSSATTLDLADSGVINGLLTGVSGADASAITDASNAIASASTLDQISQAQSQYLDTIAPGSSTLVVTTPTNDITPNIRVNLNTASTDGTAVVTGDTVALIIDGVQVASTVISSTNLTNGYVSFTASTLAEGSYVLSAKVIDQSGNIGDAYTNQTLIIDTTAPISATINTVAIDNVINAAEKTAGVTVSGTTESGTVVSVNGNAATVTGTSWSYTLNSAAVTTMGEGSETLTIVATDTAGNTTTTTKTISVDTSAPTVTSSIVSVSDNVDPTTGNVSAGSTTNDNTLAIAGTLSASIISGDKVAVYDGSTLLGYASVSSTSWSFTTPSLSNATHSFTTKVIDSAGNSGTASSAYSVVVNATVPTTTATITNTDVLSNSPSQTLSGTVSSYVSGEKVVIYDNGIEIGQVTLTSIAWSYTVSGLEEGSHSFTATVANAGGNQGSQSGAYALTIDTTAPIAPTLNTVAIDNSINASEASSGVTISGTAESGTSVLVNGNAATVTGTTWSYVLDSSAIAAMGEGSELLTIVATDAAGNSTTTTKTLLVDTVAPTVTLNAISTDNAINKAEKTAGVNITGTADANTTVVLTLGSGNVKSVVSDSSGNWTYTLGDADYKALGTAATVSAKSVDSVGNTTEVTQALSIDVTAPTLAIAIDPNADVGAYSTDRLSNIQPIVLLTGTEANTTVEYSLDGSTYVNALPTLSEGANTIYVKSTDSVGNTTIRTTSYTLDTAAPTATIALSDASLKVGETATVTITFSEVVSGFTLSDVSASNGTLSNLVQSSTNSKVYTATFTPTANIESTTNAITLATSYTDIASNIGTTANSSNYSVDTLAPLAPTVALTTDSGASSSDKITNVATLSITAVESSSTVQYSSDGTTWSNTQPTAMEGSNTLHVKQIDAAGNVSAITDFTYTLDTTLPTITSSSSVNVATNTVTTAVVYTATASEPNVTYALAGTDAALFDIHSTTGQVTFKTSPDYDNPADSGVNNVYDIQVQAIDVAGNISSVHAVTINVQDILLTVDTVAANDMINATEAAAGVVLTGTINPSAGVTINGNAATVTGTTWSYTLSSAAISAMGEGSETLSIVSTGQTVTKDITIDTVAPTISIDTIATDGSINAVEKASTGVISGTTTAEDGQTVIVKVNSTQIGTTTVSSGTWSLTGIDLSALTDATYSVTADVFDTAGNKAVQATQTFMVDATVATPIVSLISDTGPIATDKITNTATVSISNAESGAIVEYSSDGTTWSTTQPTATQGTNTLHVRQTDAVGNISSVSDFTFTYDSVAPAKIDTTKGIYSVSDENSIVISNLTGDPYGAKLVLTSDGTVKLGSSVSFSSGAATLDVSAQSTVTSTQAVAYDLAGNGNKTSAHIFLGTAANDTLTSDTTSGDAMFGFGGTDTFVLNAGSSTQTIADYENGESITLGSSLSLWSSTNAPANWSVDSSGMATYTGVPLSPSVDLATQFFTDFKAATGAVGAVVGLVVNGRTYIFGEGATTADTDNYHVRMVGESNTVGLEIVDGKVQLLSNAVDFDITPLLSSGITFYNVSTDYGYEYSEIVLQGSSGEYFDYSYSGSNGTYSPDSSGTVNITNNTSGVLTVVHDGVTETIVFSNAQSVSSIEGVNTTGLNQVNATFTVQSVPTVEASTDWWESGYGAWNGSAIEPFTSLAALETALTNSSDGYSVSIGSSTLHVKLQSDGTLHLAAGTDDTGWTDTGTSLPGSWTQDGTYLIISVDNIGTTAFTMDTDGVTLLQTEIDAVGTTYTEIWYYGVDNTVFVDTLTDIFNTIIEQSLPNTLPVLTLHNGVDFAMDVKENETDVTTFTSQDSTYDTVTYSLGGNDAALFNISSSGVLTFKSAPDYETPLDTTGDNIYNITVIATDVQGATDSQNVSIHVKDLNEGTPVSFDAATMIASGTSFYSLYQGANEFDHVVLNNDGTGTYTGYTYDSASGFFITNDSGTLAYTQNSNGSLNITSPDEGNLLQTMVLSNAQTAVSSEGTDISAFGLNQVTATFTVVTPSALDTTEDWWETNYTYWDSSTSQSVAITDLATLQTQLVAHNQYMNVWITDDVQVSLNSDGTLTEMVWTGNYNTGPDGIYKELVRGSNIASTDGGWSLDSTNGYLIVSVDGVGEAVFKAENETLYKTEIDAVGSTESETLFYSDSMEFLDIGNAIGNVTDPTHYQGVISVTQDNNGITLLPQGSVDLDLSSLLQTAMTEGSVYKIDMADDGTTSDSLTLTAESVGLIGVNQTLYVDIDSNDSVDLTGWTEGSTDVNGYTSYTQVYNTDTATLYLHTTSVVI